MKAHTKAEKEFMFVMRGIPVRHVVAAMNALTPSYSWRSFGKGMLAITYDRANSGASGQMYAAMRTINTDKLRRMALAHMRQEDDWREA